MRDPRRVCRQQLRECGQQQVPPQPLSRLFCGSSSSARIHLTHFSAQSPRISASPNPCSMLPRPASSQRRCAATRRARLPLAQAGPSNNSPRGTATRREGRAELGLGTSRVGACVARLGVTDNRPHRVASRIATDDRNSSRILATRRRVVPTAGPTSGGSTL